MLRLPRDHASRTIGLAVLLLSVSLASTGCSSSSTSAAGDDAGKGDATHADAKSPDAKQDEPDAGSSDADENDGATDAVRHDAADANDGSTATALQIVRPSGAPLEGLAGDALSLEVVVVSADSTAKPLPDGTKVTWTTPTTVVAEDPTDAGASSALPDAGSGATGIFVANAYRPERKDYAGTLFLLDPGVAGAGTLTVTAIVTGMGTATATVTVSPTPAGDPDAGATLYRKTLGCSGCHGDTGDGSPVTDAGTSVIEGKTYPFAAPGLNNTSPGGAPNLAADPAWNAALLGMAAQADIDNAGVALRQPMPDWLGQKANGHVLGAQDFAHIYAFLKTQTQ